MSLSDQRVGIDGALAAVPRQRRKLVVTELRTQCWERGLFRCNYLAQPEIVHPGVIRLLKVIPTVVAVIIAPVLAIKLRSAVRQNPSKEQRDELVVPELVDVGIVEIQAGF